MASMRPLVLAYFLLGCALGARPATDLPTVQHVLNRDSTLECTSPTSAGYVSGSSDGKVELYFAYFEGQKVDSASPVVLWLQGGPGCASTFGMLYELGPCSIFEDEDGLTLRKNPGYWGSKAGLLFIDQPYGTGYSVAEHPGMIPGDVEMGTATQLYTALWNFFDAHPELSSRPLIVAGESYGGKFVPSITHFILQASHVSRDSLKRSRLLPVDTPEPNFKLAGMAVGNGLTDPVVQEGLHAEVAAAFGLIDEEQKEAIEVMQDQLISLIKAGEWAEAHALRSHILSTITSQGGLGTMLDVRRLHDYDGQHAVDRFLDMKSTRHALNAKQTGHYESCSKEVGRVMATDTMRSVAHLVPDILEALPCLFYQGQFDGQDGPRGNEKWMLKLAWSGASGFVEAERKLWHIDDEVAGYTRCHKNLHHVVIRNAGHMAPHDQPHVVKTMIDQWLEKVLPAVIDERAQAELGIK